MTMSHPSRAFRSTPSAAAADAGEVLNSSAGKHIPIHRNVSELLGRGTRSLMIWERDLLILWPPRWQGLGCGWRSKAVESTLGRRGGTDAGGWRGKITEGPYYHKLALVCLVYEFGGCSGAAGGTHGNRENTQSGPITSE